MTYDIEVISMNSNSSTWPISDNWWQPNTYTYWTYPNTVYMYQIKCPSCIKMNWAELEKTVACKNDKCKATLRAVSSKPEHIVEVET